jgi:probable DNA repair protein
MMCAVDAAAGGQQHLGLTQIKSRRTGNQEQHPAHQQVGNETLHLCSLEHFGWRRANLTSGRPSSQKYFVDCKARMVANYTEGMRALRGFALPTAMHELLDRGGIILTSNARAARALHHRYARNRQAEGALAWPTPQILDLHSWLAEQWKELLLTGTEDRLLLNELQELALWQRIMKPALSSRSLIEPAHMAKLAHDTYCLLAMYNGLGRLNDAMWMAESSAEPEVFRQWARTFQQECERNRWMPRCELTDGVTYALRFGVLTPPSEIGWLGFDRATPAEQALQTALEARGAAQQVLAWGVEQIVPPTLYPAQSEAAETTACAAWLRTRLEADPEARIGILMPDLASRRPQLERDLYALLNSQQFPITAGATPALRFEFSLGQPLAKVPLVHAALLLLRWLRQPLTQQEISWLLLSSTFGAAQGHEARHALAHLDMKLRNTRCAPPEMALEALLDRQLKGIPAADLLYRDLGRTLDQHRRSPRRATASGWVRHIANILRSARWGERSDTSSLLFQTREAWERMLDSVASLDFANGLLSYQDFLATLERAARETIFAPESEDAPVQVMGAYAASGQSFDAVWFLGATDTGWPASNRPNPLLPVALQREFGMPHASATDNTALAQRAMERIADSCSEVVYSYAQMSDDAVQRPSSLVSDFAPAEIGTETETQGPIPLEVIADDLWIPFTDTGIARGGHMPLKRQADCPFQAFVFHRLNVRELSIAGRGLSPGDRGTLIHKVMEGIWSKDLRDYPHLTGHADLLKAAHAGTLRPLVAEHAAAAIRSMDAEDAQPWQRAYLKAEEERAVELVMDWLEVESQRQPFQIVTVEQKTTVQVGNLALSVRADRIDRVPGGELLIDYKTGEVSTASWEGTRPEQPQLPLYAAFGGTEKLIGAVFAQVRRPEPEFKGRVNEARANLSGALDAKDPLVTAPYTDDLVEEWRGTLLHLSESFVRGEAQVDPHVYPKSCQYCPLHGVCRVAELRGSAMLQETADEEDAE